MSSSPTLAVFLHEERLGELTDVGMGYAALDFAEEAVLAYGVGSRALSLSLPLRWETVSGLEARPYFEGLLPEGGARERIAQARRLSSADGFALLRELGRDCAGALTILPPDELFDPHPGSVRWLSDDDLAQVIADLPDAPLGIDPDGRVRLSLAGVQDKLVVCVREETLIGLPLDGHPSTHILKPPAAQRDRTGAIRFPGMVENEAFCMLLAAAAALPAASVQVTTAGGERALLIERFDRVVSGDAIARVHQEDACQALGVDPLHKYEEHGGPALAGVAEILREFAATPIPDLYAFLDLVAFNVLIGNCDAHGKNISLLHREEGAVELAPAYDLVSTACYPGLSTQLAMGVGGVTELSQVGPAELVSAYGACGVGSTIAGRRLSGLLERVVAALEPTLGRAEEEGWSTPLTQEIADRVRSTATSWSSATLS